MRAARTRKLRILDRNESGLWADRARSLMEILQTCETWQRDLAKPRQNTSRRISGEAEIGYKKQVFRGLSQRIPFCCCDNHARADKSLSIRPRARNAIGVCWTCYLGGISRSLVLDMWDCP